MKVLPLSADEPSWQLGVTAGFDKASTEDADSQLVVPVDHEPLFVVLDELEAHQGRKKELESE